MKKLALQLLTLVLFLSLSIQAMARVEGENGWSSSGGDDTPASVGAAWFLGKTPIKACLIIEADYPKTYAQLSEIILKSSKTWKEYYNNKVLPNSVTRLNHPSFDISLSNVCDSSTELKFIFGVKTPEVLQELKKYYNPFGFATLQSYDIEAKRGKGFIWMANPKEAYAEAHEASIHAMILHELGHVYGVPHVAGTIMDEKIAEIIRSMGPLGGWPSDDPKAAQLLTQIDNERPLYFSYSAKWSYNGFTPKDYSVLKPEFLRTIFDRDPVGVVKARFYNEGPWVNYKLELNDSKGSRTFQLEIVSDGTVSRKAGLFKVMVKSQGSSVPVIEAIDSNSWEIFANFVDQNGKRYPAVVTLNLGDYEPIQVRVFYKTEVLKIFGTVQAPAMR